MHSAGPVRCLLFAAFISVPAAVAAAVTGAAAAAAGGPGRERERMKQRCDRQFIFETDFVLSFTRMDVLSQT
jgi:hypothetical protein